jgi:hypothetical protein
MSPSRAPRTPTQPKATAVWSHLIEARTADALTALEAPCPTPVGFGWSPAELMTVAAHVVAAAPLVGAPGRHAAARQQVACLAAVFGRWFAPTVPGWVHPAGEAPGCLLWTDTDSTPVLDVLRCGHRTDALLDASTREAVAVVAGRHPGLRVRLLRLTSPLESRCFDPVTGQLTGPAEATAPLRAATAPTPVLVTSGPSRAPRRRRPRAAVTLSAAS